MKSLFQLEKKLKVKICGLSVPEDIQICTELGVDALGFLVKDIKESSNTDVLLEKEAKVLISYVPHKVKSVLLIKFSKIDQIVDLIENTKPDIIQIQKEADGVEIAKTLRKLFPDIEIIKTLYNTKEMTLEKLYSSINKYAPYIDAVNLDSGRAGRGEIHDWDISADISRYVKAKKKYFILAGGLNAYNLEEAYHKVKPDMVDIMSSVRLEERLDKKDPKKIEQVMNVINHINNSYEIQ